MIGAVQAHATHGGVSVAVIVIAVVAGLLVLGALAWALVRWQGRESRHWENLRQALAEASYHAQAALGDLADWLRYGR